MQRRPEIAVLQQHQLAAQLQLQLAAQLQHPAAAQLQLQHAVQLQHLAAAQLQHQAAVAALQWDPTVTKDPTFPHQPYLPDAALAEQRWMLASSALRL